MHTQRRPRKAGFTLIGPLVVVAIIATLASILFPAFAKARQITCVSDEKQMGLGTTQAGIENNARMSPKARAAALAQIQPQQAAQAAGGVKR